MAHPKNTTERQFLGTHIIAEFFGCSHLNDLPVIREALIGAANACGATILGTHFHTFEPQGLTGYVLLAESHISVHTWPEYGYAAVDVYTCGLMQTEKAVEHLREILKADRVEASKIMRGDIKELPDMGSFICTPSQKAANKKTFVPK